MPTKELLLMVAVTSRRLVEVNPNRRVLVIANCDPGSVLWICDKPPTRATAGLPIYPYGQLILRATAGDKPEKAWYGLMAPAGGLASVLEEMGTTPRKWW